MLSFSRINPVSFEKHQENLTDGLKKKSLYSKNHIDWREKVDAHGTRDSSGRKNVKAFFFM